jgi:hypothetical protein
MVYNPVYCIKPPTRHAIRIRAFQPMEPQTSSTLSGCSPGFRPAKNPNGGIEMVFRFWGANVKGAEAGSEHASASHPGVLALIEDAVVSKHGVFLAARDQLYVSGLKQSSDALVISRQVQLALQGFRGRLGSGPVAISIAIDAGSGDRAAAPLESNDSPTSAAATHPTPEPPHDLVTLLKLSKPAQILLTHDLCQQMTGTKGLPLKSFPGRFGVYEYLWTSEEKLDLLQSEPQLTLAALPVAQASSRSAEVTAAGGAAKSFDSLKASGGIVREGRSAFQWPGIGGTGLFTSRNLFFALSGVVVIGAAIAVGVHLAHRPVAGSAVAAPTQTAPTQAAPTNTNPPAAVLAQPAAVSPAPTAKVRAGSASIHAAQQSGNQTSSAVRETPAPASGCSLEMDAGRLVRLGEQARGRGDYTNAVRIFREVLACDPNNVAAREGLNKATRGEEQR